MRDRILAWLLVAVTIATASPVAVEKRAVTTEVLSNLKLFSQYSATAYCNYGNTPGQTVACANNACPLVEAAGATTHLGFASPIFDIRGQIAIDPSRSLIVLTFRGTSSIRNWITDLSFVQITCPFVASCRVHVGFATAWAELSPSITSSIAAARAAHPTYRVVATGHSLGGAIATLAAAYLRRAGHPTDLYTYGSPRVGNLAFVTHVTQSAGQEFRVTHADDIVPRLPPTVANFRHVSPEYWVVDGADADGAVTEGEVEVCVGYENNMCNGGTTTVNGTAHVEYLGPIAGCATQPPVLPLRRRDGGDLELEQRLRLYAELDRTYVDNLHAVEES